MDLTKDLQVIATITTGEFSCITSYKINDDITLIEKINDFEQEYIIETVVNGKKTYTTVYKMD